MGDKPGRIFASYATNLTFREAPADPGIDSGTAPGTITAKEPPTLQRLAEIIENALKAEGFDVNVNATRTDR